MTRTTTASAAYCGRSHQSNYNLTSSRVAGCATKFERLRTNLMSSRDSFLHFSISSSRAIAVAVRVITVKNIHREYSSDWLGFIMSPKCAKR